LMHFHFSVLLTVRLNFKLSEAIFCRQIPASQYSSTLSQIPLRYLVADRSEDGRRHAASWNLAYHLPR